MNSSTLPKSPWPMAIRITAYALAAILVTCAGFNIYAGTDSAIADFFTNIFNSSPGQMRTGIDRFRYSIIVFTVWATPAAILIGQFRRLARRIEVGATYFWHEEEVQRRLDRFRDYKRSKLVREREERTGPRSSVVIGTFVLGWIVGKLW